jgi:putative membrane protein
MFLAPAETAAIEARVAELEASCGVEVVTLIIGKADVYPETVWKAFALGAAITCLVVTLGDILRPDWVTSTAVLGSAIAILGVGATCALLAVYIPAFARLFLRASRAELEVRQYAKMQFLEREVFATPGRTGILLLVSLLERRVVILPDKGLHARVGAAEWNAVIARMGGSLRTGMPGAALLDGLAGISELLVSKGFTCATGTANLFANTPIEDTGA